MPAALPIMMGVGAVGQLAGAKMGSDAASNAAQAQLAAAKYSADLQKQMFDTTRADAQPWRQAGISALYGPGGLYVRKDGGTGMAMTDPNAGRDPWVAQRLKEMQAERDAQLGQIGGPMADEMRGQLAPQLTDDILRGRAMDEWNNTESKKAQYQSQIDPNAYMLDPSLTKSFTMEDFQKDPGYDFRMQEGQKALERANSAKGSLGGGAFLKALTRYGQDYASNEFNNAYNRYNADRGNRFNTLAALAGVGQVANQGVSNAGMQYGVGAGNAAMEGANAAGAAGIAGANAWNGALSGLSGIGKNWMDYTMGQKYLGMLGGNRSGITNSEAGWGSWTDGG